MNVKGIIRLTFKQDHWNSHTDVIEYNDNGDYIGAWCDLKKDGVPIEEEQHTLIPPSFIHSTITYSGIKPDIKVNGSGKKFIVKFYNDEDNENEIPVMDGRWEFKIETVDENKNIIFIDATDYVSYEDITKEDEHYSKTIKVKFIGTDEWINKNLRVYYISNNNIRAYVTVNIVGL